MNQIKIIFFILIIVFLFCSCGTMFLSGGFKDGDWFYLENEGALMPVWVNGNIQSEIFIIYLHGGPGAGCVDAVVTSAFKELQKNFAVVCYEQRGSGSSQGSAKNESKSITQFTEDLEKIIALIKYKYNNPKLFLMSHSWGGTVGTSYLLKPENQQQISGWISINSGYNLEDGALLSIEWAENKANEQITSGININYWQKELEWYSANPDASEFSNVYRHFSNIDKLRGVYYDPSRSFIKPEIPFFNTPYSIFYFLNIVSLVSKGSLNLFNYNYFPQMYNINIPSLILWGIHDGVLPVDLAYDAYNSLGSDDKTIFIFENSAHIPYIEEPLLFAEKIIEFINRTSGQVR